MTVAWKIAFVAQSLAIVLLGFLLLGLLRRVMPALEGAAGQIAHTSDSLAPLGLQPGSTPEPFTVLDNAGKPATLNDFLARTATLVVFMSHDCAPCVAIASELTRLGPPPENKGLVVIEPHVAQARPLTLVSWLSSYRDDQSAAVTAFRTNATPHAFLLDAHGVVRRNFIPRSAHDLNDVLHSDSSGAPSEARTDRQPTPVGPAHS